MPNPATSPRRVIRILPDFSDDLLVFFAILFGVNFGGRELSVAEHKLSGFDAEFLPNFRSRIMPKSTR